jgi:YHS domain-containing protein
MMNAFCVSVFGVFMALMTTPALAVDVTHSTPGISGYDPLAYFTDGKPMKDSGYHVADYKGVTYACASKDHKTIFQTNPEKYIPAYGGYSAYGVAMGKKFE